ncbi:MAG: baseplate J/gp47 family protein [Actinomycetia bacterium]|nr:baseplate J/gp47 family protein [Actinomycetes bacterium]
MAQQATDAFVPWTAAQTTQDLIQTIQAVAPTLTDFTPGSVLRSLCETWGIESQKLGEQVLTAIEGTIQTLILRVLGITPQPAQAAYGQVQFSVTTAPSSPVTLPQGFTVAIPNSQLTYVLGAPVTWPAGQTSLLAVVTCTQAGAQGNAPANTITQIVSAVPSGLTGLTVNNPQAFITGADAQTVQDALAQVPTALAQLRTATPSAVAAAALAAVVTDSNGYVTEQVAAAVAATGTYVPNPSNPLSLTAGGSGSSLAAGTVYVANDFTTAYGRTTTGSSLASVTVTAGQTITTTITLPTGSTGTGLYVGTTNNPLLLGTISSTGTITYAGGATSGLAVTVNGNTLTVTISATATNSAPAAQSVSTGFAALPGYATVWIANSANTPPSSSLLQNASNLVFGYTDSQGVYHPGSLAAGIQGQVLPATLVSQPVTVAILPQVGYTLDMVQTDVELAVTAYFDGLDIGQGITWTQLLRAILAVPTVADAQLTTPSGDVAGVVGQRYILGALTVSQLG